MNNPPGDDFSNPDALLLTPGIGDGRELLGEQLVEAALQRRVEGGQHVVRGLVGGGVRPGAAWRRHGEEVRRGRVRDRGHRVVLGRLQEREAAGGMHSRGLSPRSAEDGYQLTVPVDSRPSRPRA